MPQETFPSDHEDGTFFAKRRTREIRALLREEFDVHPESLETETIISFLRDLSDSLSNSARGNETAAFHSLIRSMAFLAEEQAGEAFAGYEEYNPFTSKAAEMSIEEAQWIWPIINKPPMSGGGGFSGNFRSYSALKMFGYTVGKTDGWAEHKRRRFLSDFMEQELPTIVDTTFDNEYGTPMSTTRLRKMANVIASNASNFYRNNADQYAVAISEWEDDLAFLKAKYYDEANLKFHPWPEPDTD